MKIPKKFSRGEAKPATTVAEVIKQLQELPGDLPTRQGDSESVALLVINASTDPFLSFEEEGLL